LGSIRTIKTLNSINASRSNTIDVENEEMDTIEEKELQEKLIKNSIRLPRLSRFEIE